LRRVRFLLLTSLAACTPAAGQSSFTGTARAIDGDSLMVGQTEVRLFGIDAPEFTQVCTRDGQRWECGAAATFELAKIVDGNQVRCAAVETDEHGRTVARCSAGSLDLNRTMVARGYATAYRHYSMDYVSAEGSAKANKRGLWSSNFQLPSEYRHQAPPKPERRATRSRSSSGPKVVTLSSGGSGGCNIKGNRGSNGWIYHVPGMPYYERTKAEEMFCSEAEASAAGYRRAKVR
jgi:endonuclease YncB( thermonuclease family)